MEARSRARVPKTSVKRERAAQWPPGLVVDTALAAFVLWLTRNEKSHSNLGSTLSKELHAHHDHDHADHALASAKVLVHRYIDQGDPRSLPIYSRQRIDRDLSCAAHNWLYNKTYPPRHE
jgi:hypothetical protein